MGQSFFFFSRPSPGGVRIFWGTRVRLGARVAATRRGDRVSRGRALPRLHEPLKRCRAIEIAGETSRDARDPALRAEAENRPRGAHRRAEEEKKTEKLG